MNKFLAKVKFKQDKNAEYLIKAFFEDFNPESSIQIKGKKAEMEIFFREPPMKIVDAVSHCEVIELRYGKKLKEYEKNEPIDVEIKNDSCESTEQESADIDSSESAEQENADSDSSESAEQESADSDSSESTEQESADSDSSESTEQENPDIDSYENAEQISVESESSEMTEQSQEERPDENSMNIPQAEEHSEENSMEQMAEEITENIEEKSNETVISKPRVKMECMPEIKAFEEVLASVDKTQPVEERVRYVLESMGLNKMPDKLQNQIVEFASTAVRKKRMSFDIIFVEAKIPIEQAMRVRMKFWKLINDFAHKYESNKDIKLLTFLSELQKIIMLENEIDSLLDFSN